MQFVKTEPPRLTFRAPNLPDLVIQYELLFTLIFAAPSATHHRLDTSWTKESLENYILDNVDHPSNQAMVRARDQAASAVIGPDTESL